VDKEKNITFSTKLCHLSVESHSLWKPKSFTLGTKVVYFRSQSHSNQEPKSFILGAKVSALELVRQYMFKVVKNSWKCKAGLFRTILCMVGTSSIAGGGIRKLRKHMSFGNTLFQIEKRRCKEF